MSTMSDRELLILAAKAAGIELWPGDPWCSFTPEFEGVRTKDGKVLWRPQQDDGDALRLAVNQGMRLTLPKRAGMGTDAQHQDGGYTGCCAFGDDPCKQTRRAILIAAAERGKTMP